MGGFFLCPKLSKLAPMELDAKHHKSLEVFRKKGLVLDSRLVRDKFAVYRFRKTQQKHDHVLEFDNGDFVLCCGTMFYNHKVGPRALRNLYDDFIAEGLIESRLTGNYCVVIYQAGRLHIFTDYSGYYIVYHDSSSSTFSNSLLAVGRVKDFRGPRIQEFYELLLMGFFAGEDTLLPDVHILDGKRILQIVPELKTIQRRPSYERISTDLSFGDVVDRISEDLSSYFHNLSEIFEGDIGSALSGGYDTRLMLALVLRDCQIPYLHVYGDRDSLDVRIAKAIGLGENISIEHVDKSSFSRLKPDEFAAQIERQVFFFDGINPLGTIDDGSDLRTRFDRATKAALQLNGAGGEIYREIWNLSDRRVDVMTFLKMRFDLGSYPFCRSLFNVNDYFAHLAEKVRHILDIDRDWLTRSEVEKLFPFLRNVLAAPNNSANNQISYSLVPFMEPTFIFPSFEIPIRFKYCGRLQAALIKRICPNLAKYQSSYGINFFDAIPLSYKLTRFVERHIPLRARILKRRMAPKVSGVWPYYMQEDYLKQLADLNNARISDLVDVSKIDDPEILSRALSMELLMSYL